MSRVHVVESKVGMSQVADLVEALDQPVAQPEVEAPAQLTAEEEIAASGLQGAEFIADLEQKTGYRFITNEIGRDPFEIAKLVVGNAFKARKAPRPKLFDKEGEPKLDEKTGKQLYGKQPKRETMSLPHIMDIRDADKPKAEWQSGGQRNTQRGNTGSFFKNLEQKTFEEQLALPPADRTRLAWLSVGYDEEGNLKKQTLVLGRNKFKRLAARLGRIHGIKLSSSKKILAAKLQETLAAARSGEFNAEPNPAAE